MEKITLTTPATQAQATPATQATQANKSTMVIAGKEIAYTNTVSIPINGNSIELSFKQIEGNSKRVAWDYKVAEGKDIYTFVTNYGGKGNSNIDVYKNGNLYVTKITYQGLKRIAISKNWAESKLHNCYLKSVGRLTTSSGKQSVDWEF